MEELNCNFFNPNWENSLDQNDPFESALSSMVSSPTNNVNENNIVVRELIGRLGNLTNSPFVTNNSSCYNTPLNSPPKLNLSAHHLQIHGNSFPNFPFSTDPGFVERAAKYSCFAQKGLSEIGQKLESGKVSRVGSEQRLEIGGDSREISSISEQITSDPNSRKRKSAQKGKGKENPATVVKDANAGGSESIESSAKRSKSDDDSGSKIKSESDAVKKNGNGKSKDDSKEPPKDYIHVRARRGQATDAHSLAERVRREKISERMKLLQDLVPGCNKVTGKAVMLDEIINYVQSLQRQVEFLSMKLSTVNPRMDLEALVSKDMFLSRGPLPPNMYPSDCYPFQSQPNLHTAIANGSAEELNHFNAALSRNQLPSMNNFNETASQVSTFWENDLHNIVHMGFGQNQSQDFNGAQMKVEP